MSYYYHLDDVIPCAVERIPIMSGHGNNAGCVYTLRVESALYASRRVAVLKASFQVGPLGDFTPPAVAYWSTRLAGDERRLLCDSSASIEDLDDVQFALSPCGLVWRYHTHDVQARDFPSL
jgi:hypothetical protein